MLLRRLVIALLAFLIIIPAAAETSAVTVPAGPSGNGAASAVPDPIKHIVILYLENQSFDSILGYWCDVHSTRCPVGGMPKSVTLSDGSVVTPAVGALNHVVPVVTHSVKSQLAAMNIVHGVPQMNGWQNIGAGQCNKASHYRCIMGYKPAEQPNTARLADKFAISDDTFSLEDSPSWGGHLYVVLSNNDGFPGTVPVTKHGIPGGTGWGCDADKFSDWPETSAHPTLVPGCIPDPSLTYKGAPLPNGGAFEHTPVPYEKTILDELDKASLSWKFYSGSCPDEVVGSTGLKFCKKGDLGYSWSICPSIAECLYTQSSHMVVPDQFGRDAKAGKLPAFSIITPSVDHLAASEHNGFLMTPGDNYIGHIAGELMKSPEWDSSVLFVTWDDCGCFYDQAVPTKNPDGTWQGPREPFLIISPYVKPHYTDSTHTTFAGVLGYVEHTFGLAALGPNDAAAYYFKNAFNYAQKPLPAVPMVTRPVPKGVHILWAQAREAT
jgi:phospholipase C